MNTKQLLTLTLLTTALTLNGATSKYYTLTTKQKANSLNSELAFILHKRGIEKDKAFEISNNFTNGNEELFTLMLSTLFTNSSLNQERTLEQLSTMALQNKTIDLTSYASIVKLAQRQDTRAYSEKELLIFENIAQKNATLKKVFA